MNKTHGGWVILLLTLALSGAGGCKYLKYYFFGTPVEEAPEEEPAREDFVAERPAPPPVMEQNAPPEAEQVEFFVVSYCGWCQKAKEWLDAKGVSYEMYVLDEMEGEERQEAQLRMLKFTGRMAFPLLVVDDGREVVQGFNAERYAQIFR